MAWRKRGVLLRAPAGGTWASHAALPATGPVKKDGFELYFSPRDERGRAHVAVVNVHGTVDGLKLAGEPRAVLGPGRLGAFDDCGTTVSCIVSDGDRRWLYYTGWTLGRSVPFFFYAGLAVSEDDGASFSRVSEAPVLGRSAEDPFLTASPCVIREAGRWRMWYVSCLEWIAAEDGPTHRYHVRYAESDDGVVWDRDGHAVVDFADPSEYALGRPCVVGDRERGYEMWSCARGDRYRLARADSADGLIWTRVATPAELVPSADGWDSEMFAYPWVVEVAGARHVLYNGNGYGRSGIGYATEVP